MKLACSSTAFNRHLVDGDLTQIEWIELCARELAADGVVLDVRHFPRPDSDYLAQIKKMAADLGLTVAALRDDGFFAGDETGMRAALQTAIAVGAPLLAAALPEQTAASWPDVLKRLGIATSLAKHLNVTLAVRNAAGSFAATTHDCKRVSKEADSAWLRFGPDFLGFDGASEPASLLPNTVLAWHDRSKAIDGLIPLLCEYRGFMVIDDAAGAATTAQVRDAFDALRVAFVGTDRT
ncbi:MAG: hypothetical protein ABI182_02335 [Candidatus Baltobacteraceae bacterium]